MAWQVLVAGRKQDEGLDVSDRLDIMPGRHESKSAVKEGYRLLGCVSEALGVFLIAWDAR